MISARVLPALASLCAALVLAGCGSTGSKGGGYYKDDGPGSDIPADILNTPDAVPRIESYAPANMRPYRVLGKTYVPLTSGEPFREAGVASWYGRKFHGRKTANGETYDMYAMTAAHPTLPLPSYARVSRPDTGAAVVVRINDRGPFHSSRVIDLSYAAAARLGLIGRGSGKVVVEAITHTEIAQAQASGGRAAPARPEPSLAAELNRTAAAELDDAAAETTAGGVNETTTTEAAETMAVRWDDSVAGQLDAEAAVPDALAVLDTAPIPTLVDSGGTAIFLQFGAFSRQENAESLARQLNRQIAMVESRQAQVSASSNLYRVQIGPYSSRTEAVNAALRIQERTGARATVATRD